MKFVRSATRNLRTAGELFSFFGGRRWWVLPIILVLFLLGAFIVGVSDSEAVQFGNHALRLPPQNSQPEKHPAINRSGAFTE